MLISTKGQYAMRIMIDLAINYTGNAVTVKAIAGRQGISEKYLEQIISSLSKAGYVKSTRGARGGYRLVNKPEEYTVGMILRTVEGDISPVDVQETSEDGAYVAVDSVINDVWDKLADAINDVVDNITVDDLVGNYNERAGYVYFI